MWTVPDRFRAKIGGNYYINVPNLIVVNGDSIFRLKRREEDGVLLVEFDVYASDGRKVATIRNSSPVQADEKLYQRHKEGGNHWWVTERATGRVICDIREGSAASEGNEIDVSVDLYTKTGFRLIAGPDGTNAGQGSMVGCVSEDEPIGLNLRVP